MTNTIDKTAGVVTHSHRRTAGCTWIIMAPAASDLIATVALTLDDAEEPINFTSKNGYAQDHQWRLSAYWDNPTRSLGHVNDGVALNNPVSDGGVGNKIALNGPKVAGVAGRRIVSELYHAARVTEDGHYVMLWTDGARLDAIDLGPTVDRLCPPC